MTISTDEENKLTRFGFSWEKGGAHIARTFMLDELRLLLDYLNDSEAPKGRYSKAIRDDNCLGKRSGRSRALSARHLADLYALDPMVPLFRNLLFFWQRDSAGQPLLALLCAYCRDAVLRQSTSYILRLPHGAAVTTQSMAEYLDGQEPGRFSPATLKSTAQNLNGTWTRSGHLHGKLRKMRSHPVVTAGAVAYALYLGYLDGGRGGALFQTEYAALLDCPREQALELAEEASRRGWIVLKRIGEVIEVLFPALIPEKEMEWLRE